MFVNFNKTKKLEFKKYQINPIEIRRYSVAEGDTGRRYKPVLLVYVDMALQVSRNILPCLLVFYH